MKAVGPEDLLCLSILDGERRGVISTIFLVHQGVEEWIWSSILSGHLLIWSEVPQDV